MRWSSLVDVRGYLPVVLGQTPLSSVHPMLGLIFLFVRALADLDLITMWFIELPEGTSLWEYTSVRTVFCISAARRAVG